MRTNTDGHPWYREPWPWILMTGPAVVIVAGSITAWLAISTNDGLVAGDYYKQGLAVNQRLQRERHAQELGVRAEVMRSGRQVRLLLSNGGLDPQASLNLKILHPTQPGGDQTVTLRPQADGFFAGELSDDFAGRRYVMLEDPAGQWRLQGEWPADGRQSLRLAPGELQSAPQK
ncbi:MAG TPA: FixH family protein [Rhodocyclaceae bacterium]|nr:FixH family protein [Rhodocyclaceae bacterium]